MTNDPKFPLTLLAQGAAMMHEMVVEYEQAGFTRAEAIQIAIAVMKSGLDNWNEKNDG